MNHGTPAPRAAPIVTSYEPFSEDPEYLVANRRFIESLPLAGAARVLDLACGAGILSETMLDRHGELRVLPLDLSRESLELARARLASVGYLPGRSVGLVEASADVLPLATRSFDAVVMGNAIHILPDPDALLAEIARVLRPGGLVAFNTSFYAGTYPPGTEKLYHHWLMGALAWITARDRELRLANRPGIRRVRGTARPAFSRPWPSIDDWRTRLARHGFRVRLVHERTVIMNRKSFEAVGAYAGLAWVLLSGYPVDIACEALQAAAGPAFTAAGLDAVPRQWLEMAAALEEVDPDVA